MPKFGFVGAGIASFASSCAFLIFQYAFVSKNLFKISFVEIGARPIISAALMAIIILVFRQVNLFLLIFVSALAYALFLFPLKTFSQTDIQLFRRLWEKEKGLAILQGQSPSGHNPSRK